MILTAEPPGNAPVIEVLELIPEQARTDDVLEAIVEVTHSEDDPVTVEYEWLVDGDSVQLGSPHILDGASAFDKGQEVSVVVRATDRTRERSETLSVTVLNTPPEAPEVVLSPLVDPVEDSCAPS